MEEECILIVEDDAIAQLTLTQHLRDLGFSCSIAVNNGKDALAALAQRTIALVFLDVQIIGEWDGIDTARRIQGQQPDLPLVFLTANTDRNTLAQLRALHPHAVIRKPYDRQTLRDTFQGVLDSSGQPEAAPASLSPDFTAPEAGVSLTDAQGRLVAVNPAFCKIHCCSAAEATGRIFTDYFPEDIRKFALSLHREFMEGSTEEGDGVWTIVDQQGEPREVTISVSRFSLSDDQCYKASTFVETDRQKRDAFVREVHHRVKNHLNVSSGLLYLQAEKIKNRPEIYSLFWKSMSRIKAMSLIHEQLYTRDHYASIDLSQYLPLLVDTIRTSFQDKHDVQLHVDSEPIEVEVDQAVACGLIINELVTNSLTHAFVPPSPDAAVRIESSVHQDTITLTVRDNGTGLPNALNLKTADTLGAQLIRTLTEQLNGSLDISSAPQHGVSVSLSFSQ